MAKTIPFDGGVGIVEGEDFPWYLRYGNLRGRSVVSAKLTIKAAYGDADPGIFQKSITTSNVAGTGHVENTGASGGVAIMRFDINAADTEAGSVDTRYSYDVKIVLDNGEVRVPVTGPYMTQAKVTT